MTVLGSSGMFATTEHACSGYLLAVDGHHLWVDAGAGTWRNLLAHVGYEDLEGVLITHRHPDHTTDLFQAYHARCLGGPEPLSPIPLWAPQETLERLLAFEDGISEAFELTAVSAGDEISFGGASIQFHAMAHPPVTLGVRVELGGRIFAYTADTGPEADLQALSKDADLLISEATLQAGDPKPEIPLHLTATEAGASAAGNGVRRLVLTHLPPGRDHSATLTQAHAAAGSVEVELAFDGMTVEV